MRVTSRTAWICGLLPLMGSAAFAQTQPQKDVVAPVGSCSLLSRAVTGAPYSAVLETESSQTLADGTRIERKKVSNHVYRDSQGRRRDEIYLLQGPPGAQENRLVGITIYDIVDCVQYNLQPGDHTGIRMTYPLSGMKRETPASGAAAPSRPRPVQMPEELRPQSSHESLGTQTIDGIFVEGTKDTTTYPAGSVDNDRPILRVYETWSSPDLKIVVLQIYTDPRSGVSTTRLTSIDRSEPDPALFRVSPDYTLVTKEY